MVWPHPCLVSDPPPTCPPLTLLIKHDLNAPVYILLPSTRPDSCNGHRKVSNALPEPDRSCPHLGSYSSAVPNRTLLLLLLLGLAQSCSLHFSFPTQQCAQPLNSQCAVVKISPTSELSLFHPDWQGKLVVTVMVNHQFVAQGMFQLGEINQIERDASVFGAMWTWQHLRKWHAKTLWALAHIWLTSIPFPPTCSIHHPLCITTRDPISVLFNIIACIFCVTPLLLVSRTLAKIILTSLSPGSLK